MSENNSIEKSRNAVAVWDNLKEVRDQFAPTLSDKEFAFFVTLGSSLNANPFQREIWAVKYDANKPASIFLGRDFYRKKAQALDDYDGHITDTVYSKDNFTVENGIPKHSYSLNDRGNLLGAYCVVYKKNTKQPFFVFVKLEEYNKGFSLWKTMPDTMLRKVAEAQALRGAFQGVFAGTYDESEQWDVTPSSKAAVVPPPAIAPQTYTQAPPPVMPPPVPVESAPTDSNEPDVFTKLDTAVRSYCNGNQRHMYEVYKTITGFTGSDNKLRYCQDIEQVKKWKNPERVAEKARRQLEERIAMKTKFKYETETEE